MLPRAIAGSPAGGAADDNREAYVEDRQRYFPIDYSDQLWRRLRDHALAQADRLVIALPYPFIAQGLARQPLGLPCLEGLRGAVLERYASHIRADRLRETPSQFVCLRLDDAVRAFAGDIATLEGWSWKRGRPEDPCFYLGEQPILTTDSPNSCITVYADRTERTVLEQSGVRLVEPLGAVAEPWPTP